MGVQLSTSSFNGLLFKWSIGAGRGGAGQGGAAVGADEGAGAGGGGEREGRKGKQGRVKEQTDLRSVWMQHKTTSIHCNFSYVYHVHIIILIQLYRIQCTVLGCQTTAKIRKPFQGGLHPPQAVGICN